MSSAAGTTSGGKATGSDGTNPLAYSLHIGFFAGLIWGAVRWLACAMHLTQVPAAFLADPWVKRSELASFSWQLLGYALFIAMSIFAGLVYRLLLGRFRGPYAGIAFGLGWWAILYLALGPVTGAVPPLGRISWSSLITDLCLFLAWGLFIGYSCAFELHNEVRREPG